MTRRVRRTRLAVAVAALSLFAAGCTSTIAGQAVRVAEADSGSQDPTADGPNGLKSDAPAPTVSAEGTEDGNKYDTLAESTISDLYTFYGEVFPQDFGKEFTKAKALISYDSNDSSATACGGKLAGSVNASYIGGCDTIVWDRGVLLPKMEQDVGEISAPTVLAHEMGHLVQARLGVPRSSTVLLEQQADCYAGAYWRWVADGHSTYFDFSDAAGMRQVMAAMMWVGDPVGLSSDNAGGHGSAFDRTFAASLGFANGAKRCNEITQAEVNKRIQQTGFTQIPKDFSNIEVTDKLINQVATTLDEYFGHTVPGYQKPKLAKYSGDTPPACEGTSPQGPVSYCPATGTVNYNLEQLQKIGTPPADWTTNRGDFSAMMLLASRYALAAQATGGGTLTGNQAGLKALCYAGTWAKWLKDPQGPDKLKLSPNDLNKAVYEVVTSPLPAGDVNSKNSTRVLDQVQALHIGIVYDIRSCFDFYGQQ
ncbi:neutral zinc metallopeptidase [Nakamurella lactea]|uniref:neutral zinc metallopeptidase n=1 Tax=Nakamurella lactea TaxID=459515 RepID=UPI000418B33F|nr:neutral zinc metallopeptidase [Nakamurella lactea]